MSKRAESRQPYDDRPEHFEIRVKGHLDPAWSDSFGGLKVIHTHTGETILSVQVADQAELHGILARVRDLNLPLISVTCVAGEQSAGDYQNSGTQ